MNQKTHFGFELFRAKKDGAYLVKGTLNGWKFDGKGRPFQFTRSQALELRDAFGYEIERASEPIVEVRI